MAKRKGKVTTFVGFKVREVRPGYFLLRVRRDEINIAETFSDLNAARQRCEQLYAEQVQNGLSAFELDKKTRSDASEAVNLLGGRASLTCAAHYWLRHHPDSSAVTVRNIIDAYLADLNRRQARLASITDARVRLNRFGADYGAYPAATITPNQVADWLSLTAPGAVNSNTYRRRLNAAFAFALKRRMIEVNPVSDVAPIPETPRMPDIWDAERVESVLRAAQAFKPAMVPLLSVMAFGGLRPNEAARLNWKDVKLSERIIRVMPDTSKIRQARVVEIGDNLLDWLAPYRKSAGCVAPAPMTIRTWRRRLAAVSVLGIDEARRRIDSQKGMKGTAIKKQRLGWNAIIEDAKKNESSLWPNDILRHSCATAWLAQHHDIYKLAEMLGNSPQVIKRHYKGLMTAKEAARYWAIMPDKETGKVISLKRQAV